MLVALAAVRPGPASRADKALRTAAAITIAILAVALVAGGLRAFWLLSETGVQRQTVSPAALDVPLPQRCPADCLRFAVRLARAELGLAVGQRDADQPPADASKAVASLLWEAAAAPGKLERVPPERLLEEATDGPLPPVLLVHRTGHLEVLVGALRTEAQVYYQVLHGEVGMRLARAEELRQGHFSEAWRIRGTNGPVPVRVGASEVRLDKIYHNFGEVAAEQPMHCTFWVANAGPGPIVLERPASSCGCVVVRPAQTKELAPGQKLAVEVNARSNAATSQRHKVYLSFREPTTGLKTPLALEILACQRTSLNLAPNRLDFGQVSAAKTYEQTVRLEEVPTDRFEITAVQGGSLPVAWELEPPATANGLRQYRLRVRLRPQGLALGRHEGELRITTTSAIRPTITLPVRFEVLPAVRAIPSVVSVGTARLGQPQRQEVELLSDAGPILDVSVEKKPAGCTVELPAQRGGSRVALTIVLSQPGVWRQDVVLAVRTEAQQHRVVLPCVGFGTEP